MEGVGPWSRSPGQHENRDSADILKRKEEEAEQQPSWSLDSPFSPEMVDIVSLTRSRIILETDLWASL